MHRTFPLLQDNRQSAWHLAAVQLSGWTSLPILAASLHVLRENSFTGAVLTILVGNALLWFIRLGIIAMSASGRQSTLDIAKEYLGEAGNYAIACLLLATTLFWFIAQTTAGTNSIAALFSIKENPSIDQFTQISVLLGLISTLFCMGGMPLLRRLCTFSFPILIIAFIFLLFFFPSRPVQESYGHPTSFAGLSLILSTNLGVTADMPTFFRHSRSWRTSVLALTLIQLVSLALGICSLYLGAILTDGLQIDPIAIQSMNGIWIRSFLSGFIFLSLVCANVANVYSASVGWELVAPKALVGRKEYFILGLALTTIFVLVSQILSIELFLEIVDTSLVNLCVVLIVGYVIGRQQKKTPSFSMQMTYFAAWCFASLVNVLQIVHLIWVEFSTLIISFLVILSVIFLGLFVRWFLKKK